MNAGHVAYARETALRLDKQRQSLRKHGIGIIRHKCTGDVIFMLGPNDDGTGLCRGQL